jgi:uncharacterized membrane protein
MLKGMSAEKKAQVLGALFPQGDAQQGERVISLTQQTQTSPVPPPDFLEGYNRHIPDGGNRLFSLVEQQSAHRMSLERDTIATQNKATLRGQWMALGTVVLMCGIGVYAMHLGLSGVAILIFGGTMVGIAAVFITGKRAVRSSLAQKRESG